MVAESFLIADIFAEHLERFVPAMLLHLEQIGALAPRLGQEAGAQTMPGKKCRVITRCGRARLDDECHGLRTDAMRRQTAMRGQASEYRTATGRRSLKSGAVMTHRLHAATIEDGDRLPPDLLIALRHRDMDDQPPRILHDVRDLDRHQFGAPERTHHAQTE